MKVLITGGAGFIGSHLTRLLVAAGADLTVVDNLSEQVHGPRSEFPDELRSSARCVRADICDREVLARELRDRDALVHLAAETGTGQSMYELQKYERVNLQGTAVLLDLLVNDPPPALRKLVVASSRSIYGEGKYHCRADGSVYPRARSAEAMARGLFEPTCPICAGEVQVMPTDETAPFAPSSFYGLTKQVQEQMVLMFGTTLGLDAFALRYQNVYGPGQSLNNPYTGLLAVFSNLVRQGRALSVFEDGHESRDFVYVNDVVRATAACLADDIHGVCALNVGSGVRTSVLEVAYAVRAFFNSDVPVNVTGAFRAGDIRHNVADISRITRLTGFHPQWLFADGLRQFLGWALGEAAADAGFDRSLEELRQRGLMGSAKP